ncbi:hypothetical protein BGZ61DRAFT_465671 [Ilyonectria robusta]|uniref:uncharacterized protein n=1 Tax=Ilyonectria robusta TaxID=1079257 RepID=UPI001E8EDAB7|nr:uncharacterized protein BGZ61DRAFT_465671 [Ilyonectria robusta]KAH8658900.1 hypothetical protein BGZ61DRAFT_465671 [Ilyonectria robusta]
MHSQELHIIHLVNINKFYIGFEIVYSFQDPHFQPDLSQLNGLRRYKGLGFKRIMEVYGYAWFLNKIDWNTLTFRQPYTAYMMFNNLSMQTVYRARYHQVRDVRIDFIRVDKAYQWMLEFSAIPICLDLLENYLRELCLCAFQKDVFFHVKSALKPECMEAALAGDIPLCYNSVNNTILKNYQPLQLAQGNRLAVKDIYMLFTWLWKSKDDHFKRQGWNEKLYCMLFQQSFHAIRTARGLIRHYAKSRQTGTLAHPLPASNIENHPINGWQLVGSQFSRSYMLYVIQPEQELIRMPENELYAQLVALREQVSAGLPQSPSIIPILELDTSSESSFFPKKCNLSLISGSDEAKATLDEEGLVVMWKKQKKSYNSILRKLNCYLERVE